MRENDPSDEHERCVGCGLEIEGGSEGCQALFDQESVRAYADVRFAAQHRLIVDIYCLQHPDRYCVSARSLAAHLTGLCVALEQPSRAEALNAAIQRWLSRRPRLEKPPIPERRSQLTIADVHAADDLGEHRRSVERWARDVWATYAGLQPIARAWVRRVDAGTESG